MRHLRQGIRMLFRQPAFSLSAVLVLSLGIGGSSAIFSIVNALFFKPLMLRDPGRLIGVYSRDTERPDTYRAFSYPNYADLRDQSTVFSSLMAHNLALVGIAEGNTTRRAFADIVSSNYFSTLGVTLALGRTFTDSEERPSSETPVAIVSYPYWEKHGADPALVGKTVQVNRKIYTIVGVAPRGFTGYTAILSPELYFPLGMFESVNASDLSGHNAFDSAPRTLAERSHSALMVIGRLKPDVTFAQAESRLAVIAQRLAAAFPTENKNQTFLVHRLSRVSMSTGPSTDSGPLLSSVLLMAMAGIVLLIASFNVASMMLARGASRRREIGIRIALGARRSSIAWQLFMEALAPAFLGGAAGLAIAYLGSAIVVRSLESEMMRVIPFDMALSATPDLLVAAATAGFCVLSALIFGLVPARSLSQIDIAADVKDGEFRERVRWRIFSRGGLLAAGQIALSFMLLTAAGLFLRSSLRAANVEPGFRLDHEVIVELDPSLAGYNREHGRELYRSLLSRVRAIPGVLSASLAATVPFGDISLGHTVKRADAPDSARPLDCRSNIVSDGYFETLAIPMLRGRSFREVETSPVAVLDERAARLLFPAGDAIGQRIRIEGDPVKYTEVVGIAAHIEEGVIDADHPQVYTPLGQEFQSDMNIHALVTDDSAIGAIRQEILRLDAGIPVLALTTMRDHLDSSFDLWLERTAAKMLIVFGITALVLAAVGLYGLRSYTVARRTREIGIRMALGARPADAQRLILREGLALTLIGAAFGLLLSMTAGKLMASLLYKVSGLDLLVLVCAASVLILASLCACWVPAVRASRLSPTEALRQH